MKLRRSLFVCSFIGLVSLSSFQQVIPANLTNSDLANASGAISNRPPTIRFISPTNNAAFPAPAQVKLAVEASDPDGSIVSVDFIVGDRVIATLTKAPYSFVWSNSVPGTYTVAARARDDKGSMRSTSILVRITSATPDRSTVILEGRGDLTVSERNVRLEPFLFRREGPTDQTLLLSFSISGTAIPGRDYAALPDRIRMDAGTVSMAVPLTILDDSLVEERETLTLTLLPAEGYTVGSRNSVTVTILDNDHPPTNQPPVNAYLTITAPKEGAAFPAPATIRIEAVAIDPSGYISRVEFYEGSRRIGVSELVFIRAPDPGEPIHHFFEWKNVPAGQYTLTAKAVDTLRRDVLSQPIHVTVGSNATTTSFVVRELPAGYSPGTAFTVTLRASPPANGRVYAVEDHPPSGWTVARISHDGVFDAVTGKVKFGPFFDPTPRVLTYSVTPPTNSTGRKEFEGIASLDGINTPIGGARAVETTTRHPADMNPANNAISISELTAYAAAWRAGQNWPAGPNPIPISYVTRAGALWKGGEIYFYNPAAGPLPLAWVNGRPTLTIPPPLPGALSSAVRTISTDRYPGGPADVAISVSPAGAASYALRETFPVGAVVSLVTDGGSVDVAARAIRWGPFHDGQPRFLRYQIRASGSLSLLRGTLSTDGSDKAVINGQPRITKQAGRQAPKVLK